MKTSIDLPDDLYRLVKSKSALEGKAVREVATALFSAWVADASSAAAGSAVSVADTGAAESPEKVWLQAWQKLSATIHSTLQGRGGLVELLQNDRK